MTTEHSRLFSTEAHHPLSQEHEDIKRGIYDGMSTRGKRFVDRIGYDSWDPFQKPKDPLDIRTDITRRTARQLVQRFMHEQRPAGAGNAYSQGVMDSALGIINQDEKFQGIYEFCLWYHELLRKEGYAHDD